VYIQKRAKPYDKLGGKKGGGGKEIAAGRGRERIELRDREGETL